jgi:cytochrome-b5 reductase
MFRSLFSNITPKAAAAAAAAGGGILLTMTSNINQPQGFAQAEAEQKKKIALSPSEFRPFKLQSTEQVSHNTTRQRFELQSPEHESGLTVASCIVARAEIDGKVVVRPYTPVSLNNQRGFIELIIKSYPVPGGIMSRHIQGLKPKVDSLEMKGPFKKVDYKPNMKKKIGMIAGGTGVTPMLQVIREILSNPEDLTEISLIFANVSEQDILLRSELDALAYLYPNFKVYYTLDKPPTGWTGGKGFVSSEMIKKHMPPPSNDNLILVCGPKGLLEHICGAKEQKDQQGPLLGLLRDAGYHESQVYKF